MAGKLLKYLQILTVTVLTVACAVFGSPVNRNKRSTLGGLTDSPCFALDQEGPALKRPLNESIADLKARAAGLIMDAQAIQEFLIERYQFHEETVGMMNMYNWMDEEELTATSEQLSAAVSDPITALTSHYHLLAENVLYIEQSRTVGSITKKSEKETRDKLREFELKLYNCMCSIKIALLSNGSDVSNTITDDVLNDLFLAYKDPLLNATVRIYVTMQDSLELMEFLNTTYTEIERSLDDTES